jgi:hypothetical protein
MLIEKLTYGQISCILVRLGVSPQQTQTLYKNVYNVK